MNILDAINNRHSVRMFKKDPIEKQTLQKILEAGIRAPSWGNSQPWEIYTASGKILDKLRNQCLSSFQSGKERNPDIEMPKKWPSEMKKRMNSTYLERMRFVKEDPDDPKIDREVDERNHRFFNAPVVIYLCMDRGLSVWSFFDMGLIAQTIMLAAKEYGLDTIPAFNLVAYPDILRKELAIPDNLSIVIGIAIGYADNMKLNKFKSPRKPIVETVKFKGVE